MSAFNPNPANRLRASSTQFTLHPHPLFPRLWDWWENSRSKPAPRLLFQIS